MREQVPTMPVLLLRKRVTQGTEQPGDAELIALIDSDLSTDEALDRAVAALKNHPVVEETRDQSVTWAQDAISELDNLPQGSVRQALAAFAQALVERTS